MVLCAKVEYYIKDLYNEGLSKSFIYDTLKHTLPFSEQFEQNRRIFNENDLELLKHARQFGVKQTVLKFWTTDKIGNHNINFPNSLDGLQTVSTDIPNSSETVWTIVKEAVSKEIKTVSEQFKQKEEKLQEIINQKESAIDGLSTKNHELALLKQEEKKEKEKWIQKYDDVVDEKEKWIGKYYRVKMYAVIFFVFLTILTWSILYLFFK